MPYGRAEAFSVSINAKVFCMRGFKFIDGEGNAANLLI